MDKRVIFAVAGSGKTSYIIDKIDELSKSLVITFTNNNYDNLRKKIVRKFGYLPSNIKVLTYFTFLHSFCYKPFLLFKYQTKGIEYKRTPNIYAKGSYRYITKFSKLYYNRIAKLLEDDGILNNVNKRIEKYFDNLFIDEVQDFAGNDFNFLKSISKANVNMLFVGDFYQHTYDTSNDGRVNISLHGNYNKYKKQFEQMGMGVDTNLLNRSYRCSPSICDFITRNLGIEIQSHRTDDTTISYISDEQEAHSIIESSYIIKLFYQKHYCYKCYSCNWGESKGIDHFNDVCVVLYKSINKIFQNEELEKLAPRIKNKLYVACTRARGNLYILSDENCKYLYI